MTSPIAVIRDQLTGDGPLDTATSRAILRAVSAGEMPETFEVGLSSRVLAFGKHDTSSAGFDRSVEIATEHGFQPTVRIAGGRAAVFHEATVRFGWTRQVEDAASTMHEGFRSLSRFVVDTLGDFGMHAEVGEIPGEYCPGQYSVHIGNKKVMGVGQRLTRNAAHVGGVIVLSNSAIINAVLVPIYELLDIPLATEATGSIADVFAVDASRFMDRLTDQVISGRPSTLETIPQHVRSAAIEFRPDHDPITSKVA
jgi:octanoyl-[GcvH]:protein N-octanoyltransferase